MRYTAIEQFNHDRQPAIGVLLVNLGTPDAPTPSAVRHYLAEFLSDPRVVELPRPLWWLILHGIILRIRPSRVARAYKSIWTDEGSPLLSHSSALSQAVHRSLTEQLSGPVYVKLAMRYGRPGIKSALAWLRERNVERLITIPLYPQYSATTTASIFDAVSDVLKGWRWLPDFRMPMHYHDHPFYIKALCDSVEQSFKNHGKPDRLLISFHGLPERYLYAGDPYYCHCQKTGRLMADMLKLNPDQYAITFQSRFGREPWLQPYTDVTLREWAKKGIRHAQVISPGFAADCLETLEELAIQNKEFFEAEGGTEFHYIPALNATQPHVNLITNLILNEIAGWESNATTPAETLANAVKAGAKT